MKVLNCVNHRKGNSNVVGCMEEEKFKDKFFVAVIDDDKVKVRGLEKYKLVERLSRNGLKLFEHLSKKHYLIQLSPAIERWLMNECGKGGINLADFGFPDNIKGWKNLKSRTQRNDEQFKTLFKLMLKNEKCDEIIELKRWLEFFKINNYNTNLDLL
ncbi:MAG TPA: hypothetical protein PKA77_00465 [Chitinophagaceae bacterium]|nr:hypothetical protein [Chitinophagaceae bacterium]